ncbi:MAG: TolC family protein [Gammaproteobacteria bacterium]|nr:TolC family protein [Gammaproteobacteria bacterium]
MKNPVVLSIVIFFYAVSADANGPLTLSLDEAILLAVRSNPNVQSSQLSYLAQKFNLSVQEWNFYPHYSFQASALYTRSGTPGTPINSGENYFIQPGVSLLTPIGTQLQLTSTNSLAGHYNPGISLQVMQPLLRGFGRAGVEAALNNAKDTEVIACLTIEGLLQNTVSAVINAYLNIVSAEKIILIDEDALKRAEKSVEQTKLFIKAGHKAGNELVTVEANVASAKSQLINDQNNLLQARYALLAAIGIDPNSSLHFSSLNIQRLIKKYSLPTLTQTKKMVLNNDIQYQIDNITLHGSTTRSLLLAEDNTRWQLNFNANVATGKGYGGGVNAGMNSLFNGANQSQSVGLTLQVPIDDQLAKQGVINAKIALKQAELALMQEKWNKETSAITGWNLVISAERSLHFAEDAEKLQNKTYNISFQKYLHGLIDSLELQSAQIQLIQAQQTLLYAQINYLKALVNLDLLIGNTLKTWHVMVRTS